MELNENANLDTGQVEDVRGSTGGGIGGGGGGFGIPIPIGGGRMGIVGTVVFLAIALCVGGYFGKGALSGGSGGQPDNGDLNQRCATSNPNRFQDTDCRNVLYINSIQAYWTVAMPQAFGRSYEKATTRFFSQQITTGCGPADSGVGPFYCPADKHVYIDLTFYGELANRFGASGQFAQAYVLAHEYGHHVQDLVGTEAKAQQLMRSDSGHANQYSVMLELQADCYAGVWAKHATETTDAGGQPLFTSVTQADVQQALDAAAAVGDDAIQKKMGGGVTESKFTHGSSAQRQQWFSQGYGNGAAGACDTFNGSL